MTSEPSQEFAELFKDGGWLRRFASTLVADRHVDDLVQSTWLAALQRHVVVQNPKRWLRAVAINLARMLHRQEGRSLARKAIGSQRSITSTPLALVVQFEVRQAVGEALLALPEPTRTILVLRYQEGLEPAEIATQLSLGASAVRQRLHRGRELVRARLHGRLGSDWRSSTALMAFALPWKATLPATKPVSIASFAAVACVAICSITAMACLGPGAMPPIAVGAAADSGSESLGLVAHPDASPLMPVERSLVTGDRQDPVALRQQGFVEVRGRIVASGDQSALAGITLTTNLRWRVDVPEDQRSKVQPVSTLANGDFVVRLPASALSAIIWIAGARHCTRWIEIEEMVSSDLGAIALSDGYCLRGKLLDAVGDPMANVRIETPIAGSVTNGGTIGFEATTTADGSFECKHLLASGTCEVRLQSPGVVLDVAEVEIKPDNNGNYVVLRGSRLPAIRGVVFGPDGSPLPGVSLVALDPGAQPHRNQCGDGVSGKDGTFEVFRTSGAAETVQIELSEHGGYFASQPIKLMKWGMSGLRVDVKPRLAMRMRVVDVATGLAVERYGHMVQREARGEMRMLPAQFHEEGRSLLEGLTIGTRVVILPEDPMLPHCELFVAESMCGAAELRVELARNEPHQVLFVDEFGNPVATEFHVVDRCGASVPEPWSDPRNGNYRSGQVALRLSHGSSDANGEATVWAPRDQRRLVFAIRLAGADLWLPYAPSVDAKPVRIVVPGKR